MPIELFREYGGKYVYTGDLAKDLNLKVILNYMTGTRKEDIPFLQEIIYCPVMQKAELKKRHELIRACCENPFIVEELYEAVRDVYEKQERLMRMIEGDKGRTNSQDALVPVYVELLQCMASGFCTLNGCIRKYKEFFESALKDFCDSFYQEMPEDNIPELSYFAENLDAYKREGEMTLQMNIGEGLKLRNIRIRQVKQKAENTFLGIFRRNKEEDVNQNPDDYKNAMELSGHVIAGVMEENRDRFAKWREIWRRLRRQTAFLRGCVTIYERGRERGFYFTYPDLEKCGRDECEMTGVYELTLAFQSSAFPVANDICLTDRQILVVTGANQGGKSTFLRSLGIAQVMFQCGMFVPAKSYASKNYSRIFTHFTRREDAAMNTGRFEEELKRMEQILYGIDGRSLILLNESFSSTTEISAAKIALDIAHGIEGKNVDLWTVTHITKFAGELYAEKNPRHIFVSAGRESNHEPRFKMVEKKPDDTSFGMELFDMVIGKGEENENAG